MRKSMMKRLLVLGLAICGLVGVANAATIWNTANTPPTVSYWDDVSNWSAGVPLSDTQTLIRDESIAECVVRYEQDAGQIVMGSNGGTSYRAVLRIMDGGVLNANALGSWIGIGYNNGESHCLVEAGGVFNSNTRVGVGMLTPGIGFLDVHGDVTFAGALQIANTGEGTVVIYQGGTINAEGLQMSDGGGTSLLDIWGDGEMVIGGIDSNELAGFIADGKILGNRLTNNSDIVWGVVVEGTNTFTNATVTAKASVPNVAGLNLEEATSFLAGFDYVVGTTSVAFVSGVLTGDVIGQDPAAGSAALTNGAPVNLVLQATSIPNLVGMSVEEASATMLSVGFVVGDITTTYIFDETPNSVLEQSPASGEPAQDGDFIDLTVMESEAGKTSQYTLKSGDWMDSTVWNTGVVPVRETQGLEIRCNAGCTLTLTNQVAVKQYRGGINGSGFATLNVMDGGHLIAAMLSGTDYASIGDNTSGILNVYTGGVFECRQAIRLGWGAGTTGEVNIDGGTVWNDNWISLGTAGFSSSQTTIKNGGLLRVLRFNTGKMNGVITMYEGTFKMKGTGRVGDLQTGLDNGWIVIAPGYTYTLRVEDGDSTLQTYGPGYGSWFAGFEDNIGAETDDFDEDGVPNLVEYALNGNPTNGVDDTAIELIRDGAGGLSYVHAQPTNDSSLVYIVETRDSLTSGTWTNEGYVVVSGTNVTGGAYNDVINSVLTTDPTKFMRLKVVQP